MKDAAFKALLTGTFLPPLCRILTIQTLQGYFHRKFKTYDLIHYPKLYQGLLQETL